MTYSMIVGKYKLILSDTHFKDFRKKPTISVYDADTNSETKIASFNSQEVFEWFIELITNADRKTENSSEKPNNSTCSKMEQVEDEPKTQMKTQNSNLTFEKRKCIDCNFLTYMFGKTWCNIKCENPHDKVCDRWQANEPQTDGIIFKGNLKEGDYKLIKTTDGWVLEGEDIVYCGVERGNK